VAATGEDLAGMPGVVVADRDGVPPAALGAPPGGVWTVVVGPEGGLDPQERARFGSAPIVTVGRFVLRADTAAPAVAAALTGRRRPRDVAGDHN
jgi:16S rRNA (uracil1498-N3)-methyltransferase